MVASKEDTVRDFRSLVNMDADELQEWLETEESQSVGIKKGTSTELKHDTSGGESVGHESGRKIIDILGKDEEELDEEDLAHMRKVNGYIKRHSAQRPEKEDLEHTRWTYSLKNWGCDPMK